METVYVLSVKGQQELDAAKPRVPAELVQLLRLVDGRRTDEDLLGAVGKSAVKVGGLRWLKASGYIVPAGTTDAAALSQPAGMSSVPGAFGGPPSELPPDVTQPMPGVTQPQQPRVRDDGQVCRILADFMVQSIRRHLGEGGYLYRRQIERAGSVQDLLPHLHPLIDAIVSRVGADAGAQFADTVAFILNPRERDSTLA